MFKSISTTYLYRYTYKLAQLECSRVKDNIFIDTLFYYVIVIFFSFFFNIIVEILNYINRTK